MPVQSFSASCMDWRMAFSCDDSSGVSVNTSAMRLWKDESWLAVRCCCSGLTSSEKFRVWQEMLGSTPGTSCRKISELQAAGGSNTAVNLSPSVPERLKGCHCSLKCKFTFSPYFFQTSCQSPPKLSVYFRKGS